MATLEQIEAALRKADAAGNAEDAKRLADAYRQMRGSQTPDDAGDGVIKLTGGPGPRRENFGESYAGQAISGVNEGIANTVGFIPDAINNAIIGPAMAGINAVAGTDFKPSEKPFLGQQNVREMMGPAIAPATADPGKQMVRRVGEEFGAAAIPVAGLASRVAQPLRMIAAEAGLTAGSGAGAAAAEQIAPDNPWTELAGARVCRCGWRCRRRP
jgi:hypothetical protein